MSEALLSPHWYKVSLLRPCLRAHVRIQRQIHRDEVWYQLVDSSSGRRHRLNAAAYRLIGRLNGQYTVSEVWDALVANNGDDALTQDEAIRVIGQLGAAELLQCELTPDIESIFRSYKERVRRNRWMELNPLAIRVRLFDPSRHLERFDPWLRHLFRPAMFVAWLVVIVPALLLAAEHWTDLTAFAAGHVNTPRYLVLAWLAYPIIKTLHELGHALALRRWGGELHDVGLTLFALVPVPYVDASAASGLPRRSQRALVSAMGIMVELCLASLALYVWLNVEAGWVRDGAFVVMLIAGVSTVLFNGNPLLRFDGYHLLCDLLELPNLGTRSTAWWRNVIQRRVFRIGIPPLPLAAGERKWIALYAPLSWVYRLYVGMLMSFWLGTKSAFLGAVIALSVVVTVIVLPVVSMAREIRRSLHGRTQQRARLIAATVAIAGIAAVTLIPVPYGTVTQAVVWLPDQAQARTETDGFVAEVRIRDGEFVTPGQILAVLKDPDLITSQARARSRLQALRAQQYDALRVDRVLAGNLAQAVAHAEAEVARLDTQVAQLTIRSQTAGRWVMTRQDDVLGTFLKKGQTIGYVVAPGGPIVRAVVAHEDAAQVRARSRSAEVRLEEQEDRSIPASLLRATPAASFKLPSAALADHNGGSVMTDPADTEHLHTLEPIFTFDVALTGGAPPRIGGRAWVRFDFGREPLATQWTYALSQMLLQHLNAAA